MNNLNKEYIAKKIEDQYIVPNGHSIMASWLYDGFDIEHLIGDHHSDTSSIKSTIYDNDGNVLDKVDGVKNTESRKVPGRKSRVSRKASRKHFLHLGTFCNTSQL